MEQMVTSDSKGPRSSAPHRRVCRIFSEDVPQPLPPPTPPTLPRWSTTRQGEQRTGTKVSHGPRNAEGRLGVFGLARCYLDTRAGPEQ